MCEHLITWKKYFDNVNKNDKNALFKAPCTFLTWTGLVLTTLHYRAYIVVSYVCLVAKAKNRLNLQYESLILWKVIQKSNEYEQLLSSTDEKLTSQKVIYTVCERTATALSGNSDLIKQEVLSIRGNPSSYLATMRSSTGEGLRIETSETYLQTQ